MATINTCYIQRKKHMQLRLIFQSKSKLKRKDLTYFKIPNEHFDAKKQCPKRTLPNYQKYVSKLSDLKLIIDEILYENQFNKNISADELRDVFISEMNRNINHQKFKDLYFLDFGQTILKEYRLNNKLGNAEATNVALIKYSKYKLNKDILVTDITYQELLNFKTYCISTGLKEASASTYLSKLRTVYNLAVTRFDVQRKDPFKKGLIVKVKSMNRNIDLIDLKKLLYLSPLTKKQQVVIDLFMLTFYLRGHDLIDILTLEKIHNGRVKFKRTKLGNKNTGFVSIKVEPEAQAIFDKYVIPNTRYLLPFLKKDFKTLEGRTAYVTIQNGFNYHRDILTKKFNLDFKFTFKVSRHTWASLARKQNIPYDVIQACLGHTNNDITSVYLAYDDEQFDEANRKVMDLLK